MLVGLVTEAMSCAAACLVVCAWLLQQHTSLDYRPSLLNLSMLAIHGHALESHALFVERI